MESAKHLGPKVKVRTADVLDPDISSGIGMFGVSEQLRGRRPSSDGEVLHVVGGTGGDLWFVRHDDGTDGIYSYNEIEIVPPAGVEPARP